MIQAYPQSNCLTAQQILHLSFSNFLLKSFFQVLNNAIATIFNDIMNRDLYMRALQTYGSLNNKAQSLLQWITMVLEKTINRDLEQIVPLWQEKIFALKRERMR